MTSLFKLAYAYDGSLLTQTVYTGIFNATVSYIYNNDFKVTSQYIGSVSSITFYYDSDVILSQAGDLTLSRDPASGFLARHMAGPSFSIKSPLQCDLPVAFFMFDIYGRCH